MIEVEIKARADVTSLEAELMRRGAAFDKEVTQADVYYNPPGRDFAATDEALRLRRQGGRAYLTYKGRKLDPKSKTRKEVEVEVGDGPKVEDILLSIGFRKTIEVIKTRRIYHLKGAEICLDRVAELGDFVELEALVGDPSLIGQKRDGLLAILQELGVDHELIRASYLEMLLEKRKVD